MTVLSNLDRIRLKLAADEHTAMVLTNMPNIRWATGFSGSFAVVIVTTDSGVLITDSRYRIQADEQCTCLPTAVFANPTEAVDFLKEQIQRLGLKSLAFDHNQVTVATLEKWTKKFEGVALKPTDDPVDALRMIKTDQEVAKIRAACVLTDTFLERLLALARPGVTERALLWALEDMLREAGAKAAFAPIILSGPRTARPHGDPSDRCLQAGDFITFDIGARLDGYCSDITRTVVLGKASERQREVYEQLLKAQVACIDSIKPGMAGKDIDGLARKVLDEKNLGQYFGHGLGHGLGALVHDSGRLSPIIEQKIEVGQVWTIEPGVYIEDFGGARIEDDIVMTETGCEVLTKFPKHLIELPV